MRETTTVKKSKQRELERKGWKFGTVEDFLGLTADEVAFTDMDEKEWLRAAGQNPAFDFLKDPLEDRYTLRDGKPFPNDKGRSCPHKYSSEPNALRHL